jgi:hypothetical protein
MGSLLFSIKYFLSWFYDVIDYNINHDIITPLIMDRNAFKLKNTLIFLKI